MGDWRTDRIGSALRGENPTVLARLPAGFAVIGDVQWLPGYCILLTDDPSVTRLSELRPAERTAYLDSMAWALLKLNQPQPALAFALRAVANSPEEDAEIFHHLGDIYAALGQTEKAREAWRNSLRLEPNELLRKKLDQGAP